MIGANVVVTFMVIATFAEQNYRSKMTIHHSDKYT